MMTTVIMAETTATGITGTAMATVTARPTSAGSP
jgi:hypothetical protein